MDFYPEELVNDRPEVGIVWMAASEPTVCRRRKSYKDIDIERTVRYLRKFMHGDLPPTIPGAKTSMALLFILNQVSTGLTRILRWRLEDLYKRILMIHGEMVKARLPDTDLPPPARRIRTTLVKRPEAEEEIEQMLAAQSVVVEDLEQAPPLPEVELNVSDFFEEAIPHTVLPVDVTISEIDLPRPATPPCNHDHQQDPGFEADFDHAVALRGASLSPPPQAAPPRPRASPSTSSASDPELSPPPLRRRRRPTQRRIRQPALNLEDLLAALPMVPIERLLLEHPLVHPFLQPQLLFPDVDEMVLADVHGMMMPFFPPAAGDHLPEEPPPPEAARDRSPPPPPEAAGDRSPPPELPRDRSPPPPPDAVRDLSPPQPEAARDQLPPPEVARDQPLPPDQMPQPEEPVEQPRLESPPPPPEQLRQHVERIGAKDVVRIIRDFGRQDPEQLIGFHQMVPPGRYSRYWAARVFDVLLQLHGSGHLQLGQAGPDAEIYIHANDLIVSGEEFL